MALTKRALRASLKVLIGDDSPVVTTAAGLTDGTTFVTSQFDGAERGYLHGLWAMIESGEHDGKYRPIDVAEDSEGSPRTFHLAGTALAGVAGIISGINISVHHIRPDQYTRAINEAIQLAYPHVYLAAMDSSLLVVANQVQYTLPAGYTPRLIRSIWMEGEGSYDEIPTYLIHNVRYSPDETKLWINAVPGLRQDLLTATRKIYIFTEKYLTLLAADTAYGALVNDSTAVVELTTGTQEEELLLLYAKARLFSIISGEPQRANGTALAQQAAIYLQEAQAAASHLKQRPVDRPGYQ